VTAPEVPNIAELREGIKAAATTALSATREVNGGELESVTTIYTPEGLAVLVVEEVAPVVAAVLDYAQALENAVKAADEALRAVPLQAYRTDRTRHLRAVAIDACRGALDGSFAARDAGDPS
jgi:hypothetical protein